VLTEDEIRHIAYIARIQLSEEEVREFKHQFDEIFELLERVKELQLTEEEAVVVTENRSEFRDDSGESFPPDDILRNAPRVKDRYFVVPKNL